jgi:hypothetical protein
MDLFLRRATPVVLLMMAGLAWFGPLLPGYEGLIDRFGGDAVLRFLTGLLCIYVAMLVLERQRMEQSFKQVLGAFRDFHTNRHPNAEQTGKVQREAVEILVGALQSPDAEVRRNSRTHLVRLTGQDHGEDAGAWRSWLAEQPR